MTSSRKVTLLLEITVLMTLLGRATAQTRSSASFSLMIQAPSTVFKIGAPVELRIILKNTSDHEIQIWRNALGQEGLVYKLDVKDEHGKVPPTTKFKESLKGLENPAYLTPQTPIKISGAWVPLKPGNTLTDPINVSRLYDLRPGRYSLQVQRLDDESKTTVKSNTVHVDLVEE
jgi:hypothetical protein